MLDFRRCMVPANERDDDYWRGNVGALRHELVDAARVGGLPVH
jgi:hypothetical protein